MAQRRTSLALRDDIQESIEARVSSGAFRLADEVVSAALEALDREAQVNDQLIAQRMEISGRETVHEIPAADVLAELRELHQLRAQSVSTSPGSGQFRNGACASSSERTSAI
jgi:Arc/MetJ-type ribon-helix-helix transcriptional regulator